MFSFINYSYLNETRTQHKKFLKNSNMKVTLSNESQAGLDKNEYR
jgi:hypothetical protein